MKANNRVNRATIALFKFENGAVGSLNHTLLMHGSNFYTELDIFGDGFAIAIRDPYQSPAVFVRRPHSDDLVEVNSLCSPPLEQACMHLQHIQKAVSCLLSCLTMA